MNTQLPGPKHARADIGRAHRGRALLAAAAASLVALTGLGGMALAEGVQSGSDAPEAGSSVVTNESATAETDVTSSSSEGSSSESPAPDSSSSSPTSTAQPSDAGSVVDSSEAAKTATSDAEARSDGLQAEAFAPLAAGPETTISAPYLYWEAVDATGALIGGATFTLAGPKTGNNNNAWSNMPSISVPDCTSGSCTGYDLDPDPGEFLVKYRGQNQTLPVSAGSNYRLVATTPPTGYNAPTTTMYINTTRNNSATATWNNDQGTDTHDFGEFTFSRTGFATIVVQVGGDRSGLTTVNGLKGVELQLYNNSNGAPGTARTESWATCTSDAAGQCVFSVPITGSIGVGTSFRPWVVQKSVPSGWFMNTTLRTGNGDGTNSDATPYRFRLGADLQANTTYRSTVTGTNGFMLSSTYGTSSTRTASGGVWQQSRDNPVLPAQCGLDVALVLDLSGSVTSADLTKLKSAATTITNSLVGTQSRAALFSFSTGSPALNATANYPALVSVSTQAQADTFTSRWSNWTSNGGTNWDRALATVAQAAPTYDVVVVITDGNPTYYQAGEGPGNYTRLREMENAIFSANAVKAEGSRILAVGVGAGVTDTTTASNLAAISGPTKYSSTGSGNATTADYFQESSYANAAAAVRAMALGNCASSVSVTKMIVPNTTTDETVTGATPAPAGWTFGTTVSAGTVAEPTKATANDGTGTINFPITLPAGVTSTTATIAETQQSGYQLVTQNGLRAVCKRQDTGAAVTVTNDQNSDTGFSVNVPAETGVSCTVYNRAPDERASITLEKQWVINGADPVPDGQQNAGFQAVPLISDPGAAANDPLTQIGWGVERTGYAVGDVVTVGETYGKVDSALQCELVSASITNVNGEKVDVPLSDPDASGSRTGSLPSGALPSGHSTVTFTNVVECKSELVLRKRVDDRNAPVDGIQVDPDLWTLTAIEPDGAETGPTGTSSSLKLPADTAGEDPRGEVTPDVIYQLAESDGDPRYVQTDHRNTPLENPDSTGTWTCLRLDPATGAELAGYADGVQGGVTVPLGYVVRCTANNETASLTLLKHVEGGTAEASDWSLTATPATGVDGLEPATVKGAETATGTASTIRVRPDHDYTLSESTDGHVGYTAGDWSCVDSAGDAVDVNDSSVSVGVSQAVTCTITNTAKLGTVEWTKVDDSGALLSGAQWSLVGPDEDAEPVDIVDCVAATAADCTGPDKDPAAGKFQLTNLEWGDYTLTETKAPAGYVRSTAKYTFTINGEKLAGALIVDGVGVDDNAIENARRDAPDLPLTGGLGTDAFLLVGGGLLALAGLGGWIHRRRAHRLA